MLRRFQLEELEKATNNFSQDCLLGSGAFGDVYKGSFGKEGTLAIKRPRAESYQSPEEFRNGKASVENIGHVFSSIHSQVSDFLHSEKEILNVLQCFAWTEVELLSKVKHNNLVGLVGYCEEPGTWSNHIQKLPPFCLTSFSLSTWNRTKRGKVISLWVRTKWFSARVHYR